MTSRSATYAAVDLGATSGRVLAAHLADGQIRSTEVGRFPNRPVQVPTATGSRLHWDVLSLWAGITDGLRVAARDHGPVTSIGIDTWGVDYGLLDADGSLLANPVNYRDPRTRGVPEAFFGTVPADEFYRRNGLQVQDFNTVFQLVAEADQAHMARAARLLLMPDLFGFWLTGRQVTELTNASTTGLLDVASRTFSDPTLAAVAQLTGQKVDGLLAPLVEPGTVLGPVTPALAGRLGLDGTRLVTVGSHDTASAVAAVPAWRPDAAFISCGTWSLVGMELDRPVLTEESRRANFTNELGVQGTVRYLRNVSGLWLLSESLRTWREQGTEVELAPLLAQAAAVPPLTCVVDVDDPVFAAPGDMPSRIAAAARATGQRVPEGPAETARCILDSLALGYRRAVHDAARLSGRDVGVVHVVGGGAHNELLCQLTADAVGVPVVAGPAEGTALGNVLLQAVATGQLQGGLGEMRAIVRSSSQLTRFEPRATSVPWERAEAQLWG